jgi:hypothetical protein
MKNKTGDIVRLVHYGIVKDTSVKDGEDVIEVEDLERGFEFSIVGTKLTDTVDSSNAYATDKKVNRTELVKVFSEVGDNVFTVMFKKQDGSSRTLRGYVINTENGMGRSDVVDLDIAFKDNHSGYDNRRRQVDHRTMESLIVGGIHYYL